jgi:hypothetical protein
MRILTACVAACLAAATLSGCSDDGVRPSTQEKVLGGLRFEVGNRWAYAHVFTSEWKDAGGRDVRPPLRLEASGVREITSVEVLDGRYYVVESQTVTSEGMLTFRWRRYRQGPMAVYRADVDASIPPGEVDVTALGIDEQTHLRLPVSIGDSWQLRPGVPAIVLTVVSLDTISLATGPVTAYRVSIERAGAGENSYEYVWYNAGGMIRREKHVEIIAVDAQTGEMVFILTNEVEELTSIELAD